MTPESRLDRVPLPPPDAQRFETVCQFCIVGCGYRVFKWPVGRDGGPELARNALGADYTKPLPPLGDWISTAMHSVVTERDGRQYNVVITPDKACVVNEGLASVRGGGQARVQGLQARLFIEAGHDDRKRGHQCNR